MVTTQIAPVTFQYSHTIGRQESRGGDGFFNPVSIARGEGDLVYVLNRGTETPIFTPCKRVTVFTVDEEYIDQFGKKVGPEDATREGTPDGSFMWPTAIALDSEQQRLRRRRVAKPNLNFHQGRGMGRQVGRARRR